MLFTGQDALKELRDLRQGDLRDKIFESYVQQRYERELRKPNQKLKFTLEEIRSILGRVATAIAGWLAAGENVFYPGEFTRVLMKPPHRISPISPSSFICSYTASEPHSVLFICSCAIILPSVMPSPTCLT